MLQDLHLTGVDIYLHQQGLNTTTPAGKALFGMMGVFAEFELGMIQERVRSGMALARAKGTKSGNAIGRPAVWTDFENCFLYLRSQGLGILKIAAQAGCGVSVVQRLLAARSNMKTADLITAIASDEAKGLVTSNRAKGPHQHFEKSQLQQLANA